jgi:GTP cyclohydrolase FolE2
MTENCTTPMADVQASRDTRQIPINKVGIKDIRHPVRILDAPAASSTPSPASTCT